MSNWECPKCGKIIPGGESHACVMPAFASIVATFTDNVLARIRELEIENNALKRDTGDLESWVDDLQSGMFINCVYCGHRYGPRGSAAATLEDCKSHSMADALTEHIAKCPKHPLSAAKARIAELERIIRKDHADYAKKYKAVDCHCDICTEATL